MCWYCIRLDIYSILVLAYCFANKSFTEHHRTLSKWWATEETPTLEALDCSFPCFLCYTLVCKPWRFHFLHGWSLIYGIVFVNTSQKTEKHCICSAFFVFRGATLWWASGVRFRASERKAACGRFSQSEARNVTAFWSKAALCEQKVDVFRESAPLHPFRVLFVLPKIFRSTYQASNFIFVSLIEKYRCKWYNIIDQTIMIIFWRGTKWN